MEADAAKDRLRDFLSNGLDLKAALGPLVSITGPVQHIHVHITSGRGGIPFPPPCDEVKEPVDVERSRRLIGIRGRLRSVPGGQRKVTAYLRREFGKAEPEDLFGGDLERLYAWVHSLPMAAGGGAR